MPIRPEPKLTTMSEDVFIDMLEDDEQPADKGLDAVTCSASSVKVARNRNLSDRLASLSEWCKSRSEGIHDTETTLTMLKKKVADIERRVNQAGWNVHLPECSNCGRSTRKTPHYWICNNCGQRHSRQNSGITGAIASGASESSDHDSHDSHDETIYNETP